MQFSGFGKDWIQVCNVDRDLQDWSKMAFDIIQQYLKRFPLSKVERYYIIAQQFHIIQVIVFIKHFTLSYMSNQPFIYHSFHIVNTSNRYS